MSRIPPGHTIRRDFGGEVAAANPSLNWATLAISIARIKDIQYEDLKCTLVVLTGEEDIFEYAGVDLTLPCGGRRHFVGALPERGDTCYIGWAVRESAGAASARTPVILGWVPAAPWMGHEWLPYQPMEPGEGLDTPRERTVAAGTFDRVRFKLRHLTPGNVLLSSSQGSDLLLTEDVLLTNRRANEIRLRDADQALVIRSLQQFHALAGARLYGGMVQREARLLPATLFSDGIQWDAPRQTEAGGTPRASEDLPTSLEPEGFLTPGLIFRRFPERTQSEFEVARETSLPPRLDPFDFLKWGSYLTPEGYRAEESAPGGTPLAVYGGKALYRVGLAPDGTLDNAVTPALGHETTAVSAALTEYRIELAHTADGTLPVTEQTDGFDAERLPTRAPTDGDASARSPAAPFIEWVLGSVVGNDAFSYRERSLYGLPLKPLVWSNSGEVTPSLVSAVGSPLQDHAATLFRITPPTPNTTGASFVSYTKAGALKAYLAATPRSAEIATVGDLALQVGGTLDLNLRGGIRMSGSAGPGNVGLNLGSATGAVVIRGGGTVDTGSAARDAFPASTSASHAPSVLIEGDTNITLHADGSVFLHAPEIGLTNANSLTLAAQSVVAVRSGGRLSTIAVTHEKVISGAESVHYGGPRDANPASGPSRTVIFGATPATGSAGGTTDLYRMTYGDRVEEFTTAGNHTTRMLTIGNLTYETNGGRWTARAGPNRLEVDATSGSSHTIAVGSHSTTVLAGTASYTASAGVSMRALLGTATVAGSAGVSLVSPVGPQSVGWILCASDREPLTGLPYAVFMSPRGQILRPA